MISRDLLAVLGSGGRAGVSGIWRAGDKEGLPKSGGGSKILKDGFKTGINKYVTS